MRALLITDGMDIGGAETHIASLARGLARRGGEVAVLSCGGREADTLEREGIPQFYFPRAVCARGLRRDGALSGALSLMRGAETAAVQAVPTALSRAPLALFRARKRLKQIAEQGSFDILHAHARLPALLLRGCRAWAGAPVPVVTAHAAFGATPAQRKLSYWGDATIAVSEDLRAHLCDAFSLPAEQITVIPNGIELDRFYPPTTPPPPYSILFASRLDADCSLAAELLCDIAPVLAEKYPAVQVTIAGGGSLLTRFFHRAEVINRGRERPLVRALGAVSDMPSLMRQSRVFVGVSRAALEAAACGCAVILAGDAGASGLLSPADPTQALTNFCCRGEEKPSAEWLLGEICDLLDSEAHLRMSALAARRMVESDFDAAQIVARTHALYQSLLPIGKREAPL